MRYQRGWCAGAERRDGVKTIQLDRPFAVFSDVHGNLPALEAILADIEARATAATLCLGDLVGYGPSPNEVALLVRDSGIPTLMGNYDQGIGCLLYTSPSPRD